MSTMTPKSLAGLECLWRDGDPRQCLVMLHGIGSNARSFERLCDHLPADWTLLSWNAPGYGGSAALPIERPVASDYADRLAALVDELGLPSFALLGHSLGTLFAADFAARHADRVSRLVLMSCAQGYGMTPGDELPEKAAARLRNLEQLGPQAFAAERAPNLLHDSAARPDLAEDAVAAMAAINPAGYAQAVNALAAGDLVGDAPDIKTPTLVVVGSQDRITPPEQSRNMHDALLSTGTATEYLEVGTAGHLVHQEKTAAVAAEITRFLHASEPAIQGVAP